MPFKRIMYRLRRARLARLLGSLGEGSEIIRPEMLTGGQRVFVGQRVYIRAHARIECVDTPPYHGTIRIGDRTTAQFYFHCGAASEVTIGNDVLIAGRVYISDHDHAWPGAEGELVTAPVSIGDGCWLGEGCAILKGVHLGPGCVVGANAVVTRSAPAGSMLVGVPARIVKRYDEKAGRWLSCDPQAELEDQRAGTRP